MPDNLEQVLNDCIDRIVSHGGSVDDCLAAYPQHAAALEPYLRIAQRYAVTFRQAPSEAAKAEGRLRLQAELQALGQAHATLPVAASFDEALDQSISRIQSGQSLEACLTAFPQHAEKLRSYLRVAAFAAESGKTPVDLSAKAAGRRRLQGELTAVAALAQSRPATAQNRWLVFAAHLQQRWATASAAAAFAVLIGSFGLVRASDDALPGQNLYPVKHAAEQVRLALDFSPVAKAQRYLVYAQRRGQEMAQLIQEGNRQELPAAQRALDQNVASAAVIAAGLDQPDAVADLQARISANASQVLAGLQDTMQQSPGAAKDQARASLKAVGQAYSQHIQFVALKSPHMEGADGVLQVRAVDPIAASADKVLLVVSQIEVHRADWPDSQWLSIARAPQVVDLLRLGDMQKFLGELQIPAGVYTQIRFTIAEASVVVGGDSLPVRIAGNVLRMERPFRVEEGKTTIALLDFAGASSLQDLGDKGYVLSPQVQLLTREPLAGGTGILATGKNPNASSQLVSATQSSGNAAATGRKQGPNTEVVEVEGTVQQVTSDTVTVDNKVIALPPSLNPADASAAQSLTKGQRLTVQATTGSDGGFVAQAIKPDAVAIPVKPADAKPATPAITTAKPVVPPALETYQGVVESITQGVWGVAGRLVRISANTIIKGVASVGAKIDVKGDLQPDGSYLASEITVTQTPPQPTPTPTPAPVSTPTPLLPPVLVDAPKVIQLSGTLGIGEGGAWVVAGRRIVIDAGTLVEDTLLVNLPIDLEGVELPDGQIQAKHIIAVVSVPPPPAPSPAPEVMPTPAPVEDDGAFLTPTPTPSRQPEDITVVVPVPTESLTSTTITLPGIVPTLSAPGLGLDAVVATPNVTPATTATPPLITATVSTKEVLSASTPKIPSSGAATVQGLLHQVLEPQITVNGQTATVAPGSHLDDAQATGKQIRPTDS